MAIFDAPQDIYDRDDLQRSAGDLGVELHNIPKEGSYLFRDLFHRFFRLRGEKPHKTLSADKEAALAEKRYQFLSSRLTALDAFVNSDDDRLLPLYEETRAIKTVEEALALGDTYAEELQKLKASFVNVSRLKAHEAR